MRTLLTAAALLLVLAAPAQAETCSNEPDVCAALAASESATDGALSAAARVADVYWTRRGYTLPACGAATIRVYDEPKSSGGTWARGREGCEIWADRAWLRLRRQDMRELWIDGWRDLCVTIVHERGHNLGLEHTANGVMQPDPRDNIVPECNSWARDQRRAARHLGPLKGDSRA